VIAALASAATGERLEYIAAMVQELKAMAAQGGHETLTGLLDLAYQEALLRRRVGQGKPAGQPYLGQGSYPDPSGASETS
jgi:hypothetical protein